jgi:hypothetical protein
MALTCQHRRGALHVCTGPVFSFRPWPATHRRATPREATSLRRTEFDAGSVFYSLPGMVRGGTMTKLNQLLARLRAMLKR